MFQLCHVTWIAQLLSDCKYAVLLWRKSWSILFVFIDRNLISVPLYQFRDGYVRSLELRGGHTTFHIKSLLSTVHIMTLTVPSRIFPRRRSITWMVSAKALKMYSSNSCQEGLIPIPPAASPAPHISLVWKRYSSKSFPHPFSRGLPCTSPLA